MFKNFLQSLDKQPEDDHYKRMEREPIVAKYWFNLGGAIILSCLTIVVGTYVLLQRRTPIPPHTSALNYTKNTIEQINTLPFPHQSFKNISGWLYDAIAASYAFDFNKVEQQISDAEYYYTPTGYSMYLKALESTRIKEEVIGKKLQIGLVPIQDPVLINSGTVGDTEFWRVRVPILTSYYAGKQPIIQRNMVEVLIIRVPAYLNQKGLAITEFNMVGM